VPNSEGLLRDVGHLVAKSTSLIGRSYRDYLRNETPMKWGSFYARNRWGGLFQADYVSLPFL
jgi:hypothetical protein